MEKCSIVVMLAAAEVPEEVLEVVWPPLWVVWLAAAPLPDLRQLSSSAKQRQMHRVRTIRIIVILLWSLDKLAVMPSTVRQRRSLSSRSSRR